MRLYAFHLLCRSTTTLLHQDVHQWVLCNDYMLNLNCIIQLPRTQSCPIIDTWPLWELGVAWWGKGHPPKGHIQSRCMSRILSRVDKEKSGVRTYTRMVCHPQDEETMMSDEISGLGCIEFFRIVDMDTMTTIMAYNQPMPRAYETEWCMHVMFLHCICSGASKMFRAMRYALCPITRLFLQGNLLKIRKLYFIETLFHRDIISSAIYNTSVMCK